MTKIDRRSFLGGVAACAIVAPAAVKAIPEIVLDLGLSTNDTIVLSLADMEEIAKVFQVPTRMLLGLPPSWFSEIKSAAWEREMQLYYDYAGEMVRGFMEHRE